jgi:hypothetical protein
MGRASGVFAAWLLTNPQLRGRCLPVIKEMEPMEVELAELKQRLERAERRMRVLSGLFVTALVVGLALAAQPAMTRTSGSTVKAPFRVVDARGKVLLQVDEGAPGRNQARYRKIYLDKGAPRLRLFDKTGKDTVVMIAGENGGQIAAQSRRSGGFAVLSSSLYGGDLQLADEVGAPIIAIQGSQAERGLLLFSPQDTPAVWMKAGKDFSSVQVVDPLMRRTGQKEQDTLLQAEIGVNDKGAILYLVDRAGTHTLPAR